MKPLILIGGGGHCKSVIDVIEAEKKYNIVAISDQQDKIGESISGYEITSGDEDLPALINQHKNCLVTVGQLKSTKLKTKLFKLAKEFGAAFPVIASSSASVSKQSEIGEGTIIFHQTIVNAGAKIGLNCIINSAAIIEHDTEIDNHVHIAPGAVINGHCKIGKRSMIGSGSILIQEVEIGNDVVIGAGSTVIRSIKEPGIYVGSPAKKVG